MSWAIPVLFAVFSGHGLHEAGLTWDEPHQRQYGQLALQWFLSGGADLRVYGFRNLYLYGAFFDTVAAAVEHVFPISDPFLLRHWLTVAFGAAGVLFAMLLCRRFFGPVVGALAGIMLALAPRYAGDALFNCKDIPFAATYVAALFFMVVAVTELPRVRLAPWSGMAIASAMCLTTRIGGLLLYCFLAILLGATFALSPTARRVEVKRLALALGVVAVVAYVFILLFWPYLREQTVTRLFFVLQENSAFLWNQRILFNGRLVPAPDVGRVYVPAWLAITTPLSMLLGLLGLACVEYRRMSREQRMAFATLVLASAAPLLYAIAKNVLLYDGVRHIMFVFPPMAMLAAIGMAALVRRASELGSWARWAAIGISALALGEPAVWYARAYPYHYTYFSPLVGGLKSASHDWETDYWGLSGREVARRLEQLFPSGETRVYARPRHLLRPFLPERFVLVDSPDEAMVEARFYRLQQPGRWLEPSPPAVNVQAVDGQVPFFQLVPR